MSTINSAERPYTAEDLAEMPDDGRRYEILGGELIVSPSPSLRHQGVSSRLLRRIQTFTEDADLGSTFAAPLDVHLSEHNILQPDILVVLKANRGVLRKHGVVGPPDVVIEIISPSSSGIDRVKKSATYSALGVSEYWLVDPEAKTMLAQELRNGRYHPLPSDDGLIRSKALNGLVIDPREIFAIPDWLTEAVEEIQP